MQFEPVKTRHADGATGAIFQQWIFARARPELTAIHRVIGT
jgi:hypothetical protein